MTLAGALALSGCGKEAAPAKTSSPNDVASVEVAQDEYVDPEVPIASESKEVCGLGPILPQEAEVCRETIELCWERGNLAIRTLRDKLLAIPPGEEQKSIEQRQRTFEPMVDLVEGAIRHYRGAQYFDGLEVSKQDGARLRVNDRIELDIDLEIARMHCLRLRGLISKDFLSPTQKDTLWEQSGAYWKTFYGRSKVKWRNVQMVSNIGRLYAAALDAFVVIDSANGEGFNNLLAQAEAGIQMASGKAETYEGRRYFEQMFVLVSKKWRAYDAFRDMMSAVDDGIRSGLANKVASECNGVLEIKLSDWNKDLLVWREDTVVACCQLAEAAGTADRVKAPKQKSGACKQSRP